MLENETKVEEVKPLLSTPSVLLTEQEVKEYEYFIAYMKDIIQLSIDESNATEIINENGCRKVTRSFIKGIATMFGSTAGIPYFNIALEGGKNIFPLGYFAGIATVIVYGGATIWIVNTLTDKLKPSAIVESKIITTKIPPLFKHLICNLLGLITSSPSAYIVSRYTNSILLIGMAYLTEVIYKTEGYYYLFEMVGSSYQTSINEKNNGILSRHDYAKIIKEYTIPHLLQNPQKIKKIFAWNQEKSNEENIQDFFEKICTPTNILVEQGIFQRKTSSKRKIQLASLAVPIFNAITGFYFSSKTAKVLWSDPYFVYASAIMLTLPDFALNVLGTSGAIGQMIDATHQRHKDNDSSIGIFISCYILSALSAFIDTYVVYDNLSQDDNAFFSNMALILAAVLFLSNTSFEGFTSSVTANNFYQTSKAYFSKDNGTAEKAIAVKKLNFLSSTIVSLKIGFFNRAIKVPKPSEQELIEQPQSLNLENPEFLYQIMPE